MTKSFFFKYLLRLIIFCLHWFPTTKALSKMRSQRFKFSREETIAQTKPSIQQIDIPLSLTLNQLIGVISVGSPPQYFNAMFDTGSAYTWFFSDLCESPGCLKHSRYSPQTSNTLFYINDDVTLLKFGSGTLQFLKGYDTVCLTSAFCLRNQTFGLVTQENDMIFSLVPFDGILGLSPSGIASARSDSIVESIGDRIRRDITSRISNQSPVNRVPSQLLNPDIISVYIMFKLSSRHTPLLSFIPSPLFEQNYSNLKIHWFNMNSDSYWILPLKDILVDDVALNLCNLYPNHVCQAVLDTGTSDILGHPDDVKYIRDMMGLNRDCISWSRLKIAVFQFLLTNKHDNSHKLVSVQITPQQLLTTDESGSPSSLDCNKGILPGSMFSEPEPLEKTFDSTQFRFILGNSFLKNIDFVLNPDQRRLGIIGKLE